MLEKKDLLLFGTKLIVKILDISNGKEHYKFIWSKNPTKLLKRSKIVAQKLKAIENTNTVAVKSAVIEYSETSHKSSETERKVEKVSK